MVRWQGMALPLMAALMTAAPVEARACRLALILAMDISSSVDPAEDALQRGGVAAALLAPEVQEAFLRGNSPVALYVFEWSGREVQRELLPWTMINDPASLAQAAETIAFSRRSFTEFPTAVGYALLHAQRVFERGPDCAQRTIDVAGDGVNNEGDPPQTVYAESDFSSITVNGLMIDAGDFGDSPELAEFYVNQLIHGPAAFVEVAKGFEDFEIAMRRKLLRELTVMVLGQADTTEPNAPGQMPDQL